MAVFEKMPRDTKYFFSVFLRKRWQKRVQLTCTSLNTRLPRHRPCRINPKMTSNESKISHSHSPAVISDACGGEPEVRGIHLVMPVMLAIESADAY